MVGGGSVQEELTSVDPPRSFAYTLSGVKGAMALLVEPVDGKWSFAPDATGTVVTWQLDHPRQVGLGRAAAAGVRQHVEGLRAQRRLEKLSQQLVG